MQESESNKDRASSNPKIRFTWQLGVAIATALFCLGYVINFISTNGYNKPALFFGWTSLLLSLVFYQQHRKANAKVFALREKEFEEAEFRKWMKEQESKAAEATSETASLLDSPKFHG